MRGRGWRDCENHPKSDSLGEKAIQIVLPQFGSYGGHLLFLEDTQKSFYPTILPRASIGTFIAEKFL